MKYLITGGCGFLGSNIAAKLLAKKLDLVIFDNLKRVGSHANKEWLTSLGDFEFIHGDIRNANDVDNAIALHKPDVIYHLAGQVAMTISIEHPRLDFEVNAIGSFNLLNSVRVHSPHTIIVYSSTNKVYGDLEQFTYQELKNRYICTDRPDGFDEHTPLDFHSPYGASKGCADQYMLDFSRIYGLKTIVFRHSTIFGGRQFATYDQGWIGWFTKKALDVRSKYCIDPFTISGNGKQVRDVLYVDDCVDLYLQAPDMIEEMRGQAFNIGGGIDNSSSIIELLMLLEDNLKVKLEYSLIERRVSDQIIFVADIGKVTRATGWKPRISKEEGILKMIDWMKHAA